MNSKRIEKLIPDAITYTSQHFKKSGSVAKVYSGYLAAFGPTVISSGLMQAVAFYTGDSNKKKVIEMMFALLKKEKNGCQENNLNDYLTTNNRYKDYAVKNLILDINIACKLAIRTFELKDQ